MITFMNRLPAVKRAQILSMLCEGNSMRSTSRMADVSINTVSKLLVDAGTLCAAFHNEMVRDLKKTRRIQADEIWSFIGAKERQIAKDPSIKDRNQDAGDCWTWTALDADHKLIIAYVVGGRSMQESHELMQDIASRIGNQEIQLTTDGFSLYPKAVEVNLPEAHYATLTKIYKDVGHKGRFSPPECIGIKTKAISGNPDPAHISTSYVERANLTMRMHMRRFTRLTNAFSRKFANHAHMVSLYTVWYNWTRIHKTLRVTPAMAAGIADKVWDMAEIVALMDEVAKSE